MMSTTAVPGLVGVNGLPCNGDASYEKIVQVTEDECDCCMTVDKFLARYEISLILYYNPLGKEVTRDIMSKYGQFYSEFRHTKLAFGKIDVNKDAEYRARILEVGEVPLHIMYYWGNPVTVRKEDIEKMVNKYKGGPEGLRWLVRRYLIKAPIPGQYSQGTPLEYMPLMKAKKVKKFVREGARLVSYFPPKWETSRMLKAVREATWNMYTRGKETVDANSGYVYTVESSYFQSAWVISDEVKIPHFKFWVNGTVADASGDDKSDRLELGEKDFDSLTMSSKDHTLTLEEGMRSDEIFDIIYKFVRNTGKFLLPKGEESSVVPDDTSEANISPSEPESPSESSPSSSVEL